MNFLPVLVISFISLSAVIAISVGLKSSSDKKKRHSTMSPVKDRDVIIKEANRRLASNPKDPQALAGAIISLLTMDPDQREKLGQAARKRIIDNYSLDKIVRRYEGVYRELARKKRF